MTETVLFGNIKDPELIVLRSSAMQNGWKEQGPIEVYLKFWNLNPLEKQAGEILRIPAWTDYFGLIRRELFERDVLPATLPEFLIVRRISLGMNSPLLVLSVQA